MDDENKISINTKLTVEDFLLFNKIVYSKFKQSTLLVALISTGLSGVVVFVTMSILIETIPFSALTDYFKTIDQPTFASGRGLFTIFLFTIAFELIRKQLGRNVKNPAFSADRYIFKPKAFSINLDGIRDETEFSQFFIKWEGIKSLEFQNALIIFYIDNLNAFVIPKRVFPTPEDAQKFYDQAVIFWNAAKDNPKTTRSKNPWGAPPQSLPPKTEGENE